jgi:hypothetical protein
MTAIRNDGASNRTEIDHPEHNGGVQATGGQTQTQHSPPPPPTYCPPSGTSQGTVANEIRNGTPSNGAGLAPDPLADLKNDPAYKRNGELTERLTALANGGFAGVDNGFGGLFGIGRGDGVIWRDNLEEAANSGNSIAKAILDTPGLLQKLEAASDGIGFTIDDVFKVLGDLKSEKKEMETGAKAEFLAANPSTAKIPVKNDVATLADTGTGASTAPATTPTPATTPATASTANAATATVNANTTDEAALDLLNRMANGGFATLDADGNGNVDQKKDGLVGIADIETAAKAGNKLAQDLMANPTVWKTITDAAKAAPDGVVKLENVFEVQKEMKAKVERNKVETDIKKETAKPEPSKLSGLEGAQENMNNMLGWSESELDRLTKMFSQTTDPAAQKQIENQMNTINRRMQQISNMMTQIMNMISNLSKMWSDISMNSIRNMK